MSHFILLSKKAVGFCNKSALHQAARNILLFPQQCLIQLSVLFLKYIENHPLQIFAFPQKFLYLRHSDLRCFLLWKMKFPCGNAAKNNAFQFIFLCHLQTGAIAAFQQAAVLLPQPVTYDRPYGVYHIAAGQISPGCFHLLKSGMSWEDCRRNQQSSLPRPPDRTPQKSGYPLSDTGFLQWESASSSL